MPEISKYSTYLVFITTAFFMWLGYVWLVAAAPWFLTALGIIVFLAAGGFIVSMFASKSYAMWKIDRWGVPKQKKIGTYKKVQ